MKYLIDYFFKSVHSLLFLFIQTIYERILCVSKLRGEKIRKTLTIFGKTLSFFDYLNYSNRI
jgi:hypothetical protein